MKKKVLNFVHLLRKYFLLNYRSAGFVVLKQHIIKLKPVCFINLNGEKVILECFP